jgi:RNA polymerase sigma-70 factor, ECF subfamily
LRGWGSQRELNRANFITGRRVFSTSVPAIRGYPSRVGCNPGPKRLPDHMTLMGEKDKGAAPSRNSDILTSCKPLIDRLFVESRAASWGLSAHQFSAALTRSATKSFSSGPAAPGELEKYVAALHVEDLALACACAEGRVAAWEHFVVTYQQYLRTASGAILRCPAASPNARELADSLLAELYGLAEGKPAERSLFRYFHGRSSLKTWLRAVLAQRHVNAIRAAARLTELPDDPGGAKQNRDSVDAARAQPTPDPHRDRYLALFARTIEVALGLLDPRDKERLRLYYAEEQTLAEIGRKLGEHESSVSRNLERIRHQLRHDVEEVLRKGRGGVNGVSGAPGLSEAEISLCFEYAAEEVPIDFATLFPVAAEMKPKTGSKEP